MATSKARKPSRRTRTPGKVDGETRVESDSLGEVRVPAERYWGAQTERARIHFRIGRETMPPQLLRAFGLLKQVAAEVNMELGLLDARRGRAIVRAAREIAEGGLAEEFPLVVWQTGSGTQTHMNVNEVIAGRANEILTGKRGGKQPVHPNDHCNLGQSSNDSFPTAMHIAALQQLQGETLPALRALHASLAEKSRRFARLVKTGRTHLMDATPLTLGQEISGWARQVELGAQRVEEGSRRLRALAQGGTAVGTGLNAALGFDRLFAARLAERTGLPFVPARNKFEALACHDAIVEASGALNTVACSLMKIGNDVRLLASGPRCGLGELRLPANEPGSSIMPGKVNPTQVEALTMVCARVIGNHATITLAGASGQLELNVFKPVMIDALLQSAKLVADACESFRAHCIEGLEADETRIAELVERSLMRVTALAPTIGYDAAARVAHEAHARGTTLAEAALSLGVLGPEELARLLDPAAMLQPRAPRRRAGKNRAKTAAPRKPGKRS